MKTQALVGNLGDAQSGVTIHITTIDMAEEKRKSTETSPTTKTELKKVTNTVGTFLNEDSSRSLFKRAISCISAGYQSRGR